MIVNYVTTAGLAVLIIIVYYVTVYDPLTDPFDAGQEGALPDRFNPLDRFLLKWLRSGPAYILNRLLGSPKVLSLRARTRLEGVLIKVYYSSLRHTTSSRQFVALFNRHCVALLTDPFCD